MSEEEDQAIVPYEEDFHKLLPAQREYLRALENEGSKKEVIEKLGLSARRVNRWMREDERFRSVHAAIFEGSFQATKQRFTELQEQLPDLALELITAKKIITVYHECVKCGHKNQVDVDTTNDTVRARIFDSIAKITGHQVATLKVEGVIEHIELTAGQKIALMKIKRGLPIGAQTRLELINMGVLNEEGEITKDAMREDVVEGESRRVDQ